MPDFGPAIRLQAELPFTGEWVLYPYDGSDVSGTGRPGELSIGVELRHAHDGANGESLMTLANQAEVHLAIGTWTDPATLPDDMAGLVARHGLEKLQPRGFSTGSTTFSKKAAGGTLFLTVGALDESKLSWRPDGGAWDQTVDIARADVFFDPTVLGLPRVATIHAMFAIAEARLDRGHIGRPLPDHRGTPGLLPAHV